MKITANPTQDEEEADRRVKRRPIPTGGEKLPAHRKTAQDRAME